MSFSGGGGEFLPLKFPSILTETKEEGGNGEALLEVLTPFDSLNCLNFIISHLFPDKKRLNKPLRLGFGFTPELF